MASFVCVLIHFDNRFIGGYANRKCAVFMYADRPEIINILLGIEYARSVNPGNTTVCSISREGLLVAVGYNRFPSNIF